MTPDEFDYALPPGRIAQTPAERRDGSRLLILDRAARARPGDLPETTFDRLPERLRAGDLLVLNDARVLPARLEARKTTGGRVDLLLLGREPDGAWSAILSRGRGLRPGDRLALGGGLEAALLTAPEAGRARLAVRREGDAPGAAVDETEVRGAARMPLPPYIRRAAGDGREPLDRQRYQTVYAARDGAVAAPTAGLHFTERVLAAAQARGVEVARLTLLVGPGTFQPVRAQDIAEHTVEAERYALPTTTAEAVSRCRARGGRVIAVGTTVVRVLEARADDEGGVRPGKGWCDLYIRPGHRFRAVDALLTNLHLPRSSLLILAAAFAGREPLLAAYAEAARRGFRFYSYGDAMLLL